MRVYASTTFGSSPAAGSGAESESRILTTLASYQHHSLHSCDRPLTAFCRCRFDAHSVVVVVCATGICLFQFIQDHICERSPLAGIARQ